MHSDYDPEKEHSVALSLFQSGKLVMKMFERIHAMLEEPNTLVFVLIDEVLFPMIIYNYLRDSYIGLQILFLAFFGQLIASVKLCTVHKIISCRYFISWYAYHVRQDERF